MQGVNSVTKLPEAKHVDPSLMAERERRQMVRTHLSYYNFTLLYTTIYLIVNERFYKFFNSFLGCFSFFIHLIIFFAFFMF